MRRAWILMLLLVTWPAQAADTWSGQDAAKPLPPTRPAPDDLAERLAPRQAPVRALRLVTDALPTVTVEPPVRLWGSDPRPDPLPASVSDTPELRFVGRLRITFEGPRLGHIHHRFFPDDVVRPARTGTVAAGGAPIECAGTGVTMGWMGEGPRVDPIRWRAVSLVGEEGLRVEEGAGWFDGHRCRLVTLHHQAVVARRIHEGTYAFIERCPRCKRGERERLRVLHTTLSEDLAKGVSPLSSERAHWRLSSVSLSLEPGTVDRGSMLVFEEKTSFPTLGASDHLVVEASRPKEGPPRILAYLLREPRSSF